MKILHCVALVFPCCTCLITASVLGAELPTLDALQGAWTAKETNQEGQVSSLSFEIKKDRLTFKMAGADGELRLFAKGAVSVQKVGPFQTLKITDIVAGRSEDAAEAVDDERTSVFILDGDTLILAQNFDKPRADQAPRLRSYLRSKVATKAPEDAKGKLAGTWKMDMHIGDTDADYQLRLSQADGKVFATLISPRSGEHKFRQVTWADEKLTMELDRDYDGQKITLVYTGKLGADGLSGTVAAKGAEDQFSGTWKAKR